MLGRFRDVARDVYERFYRVELSEQQVESSPKSATPSGGSNDMKISARNVLKGRIIEVTRGATTAHVKIDVGGIVVTSSITNAAVDDLKLAMGKDAYAVIKASDVMIGID